MSDIDDPTDEDYARAAEHFLREKDLPRAMEQIAAGLTLAPSSPPCLALFDRIVSASKTPLLLAPVSDGTFFGLVAARARILAKVGRLDEALHHVFQAAAFRPSVAYLPWALPWLEKRASAKKVGAKTIVSGVTALLEALDRAGREPGVGANLEAALTLAERVRSAHDAPELLGWEARLLETLGRDAEATSRLEAAGRDTGRWEAWAALGAHHRRLGETDRALEAYARARELAPTEPSVVLDLGDAGLDAGRLEEAAAAYEAALALRAGHPWASASLAFVRAVLGGGDAALEALARAEPTPGRAAALLAEARAYVDDFPLPRDPVSSVVRRALERAREHPEKGPIRLRIRTSHPEPPSAHAAFRLGLARLGREGSLEVVSDAPRGVASPLEGLEAPSQETTSAVVRLLAGEPAALEPDQLLRALAHPGALSAGEDAPRWVLRWQIACAEQLAQSDEGRSALARIAGGPDDLALAATVVALARAGRTDGFEALLDRAEARRDDPPSYAHALAWCWLRLEGHDAPRRTRLFALARRAST